MPWKRNVLVLANVTATSPQLIEELTKRASREPTVYQLIVPAAPVGEGHEEATKMLAAALERLHEAGLEAEGAVGAPDPVVAVTDAWDPKRYDEIVVSTLPMRFSKWLHAGLPERIGKLTDAPVIHVVSEPPKPAVATSPPPEHESNGLGPLSVLGWGAHKD